MKKVEYDAIDEEENKDDGDKEGGKEDDDRSKYGSSKSGDSFQNFCGGKARRKTGQIDIVVTVKCYSVGHPILHFLNSCAQDNAYAAALKGSVPKMVMQILRRLSLCLSSCAPCAVLVWIGRQPRGHAGALRALERSRPNLEVLPH